MNSALRNGRRPGRAPGTKGELKFRELEGGIRIPTRDAFLEEMLKELRTNQKQRIIGRGNTVFI